ncbi:hypothetical protein Q1695_000702 [Nippostrongylus brasiliensis]|nr:hypothetical protein Q1695_000702 [Nippostrongylus brasiliensis]
MGRKGKGRKKANVEKSSSESADGSCEEVLREITNGTQKDISPEEEQPKCSPIRLRSRLPVPCASGLSSRLSTSRPTMAFQRPNFDESPDCKRSMIPRLLPIPLVRQRGAAVEVENYDDETNRPEGLAHL